MRGPYIFCFRILSIISIFWASGILENLLNILTDTEIEPSGRLHPWSLKRRLNQMFNSYKGRKFDALRKH